MTIRDISVAFGFEVDRNSEQQAENSIKGIKNLATKLLGVIGIGFSIAGLSSLAETAAEAEALKSQFTQVFGEMEVDASGRLDAIADETGVAVNRMKGSFTQIAAFSKTTGLDQAQSLEIADRAMKAVTDSAAFYDRTIEDVTESMRSFLKGNFEQDAALGLSATETTRNAAANKLYSKSFNDLSEAEKQFTLLSMVEEANQASGAIDQAARESDTWTNQLGNLKQSVTDLKAAAGNAFLEPAVQVLKILNGLVQKATAAIQKMTGENGVLTRSFERFHAHVKRLQPAIDRMGQTLSRGIAKGIEVVKGLADKFGGVGNVLKIAAIAAGAFLAVMGAAKILNMIKAVGGLVGIVSNLAKAFSLANLKTLAIIAVVVILALIVEDFIHFMMGNDSVIGTLFEKAGISADDARQTIINAWNKVKEFLLGIWDFIKQAAFMWVDTVKGFFEKHGESIRQNFERAWGLIQTFLEGVWTFLSQLATTLFGNTEDSIDDSTSSTKDKLLAVWEAVLEALSGIWDALYEAGSAIFNAIAEVVETVFGWIQVFWSNWGERILSWFQTLWDSLGGILDGFLEIIKGVANFISSVFSGDWQGAWEAIKQVFIGIWEVIVNLIAAVWDTITMLFEMALGAIKAVWEAAWNGIKSFFRGILDWIESKTGVSMDGVRTIVSNVLSIIQTVFSTIFENIKVVVGGVFENIKTIISTVMDVIKGVISVITSAIHGDWQGVWEGIKTILSTIWDGILRIVSTTINMVWSVISNILSAILSVIQRVWENIKALFQTYLDLISAAWQTVWDAVSSFFQGVWNGIVSFVTGVLNTIISVVSGALTGAYHTVVSALTAVKNFFSSIFSEIANFVSSIFSNIRDGVSNAVSSIKDVIVNGFNAAVDFIKSLPGQAVQWGLDFITGLKDFECRGLLTR